MVASNTCFIIIQCSALGVVFCQEYKVSSALVSAGVRLINMQSVDDSKRQKGHIETTKTKKMAIEKTLARVLSERKCVSNRSVGYTIDCVAAIKKIHSQKKAANNKKRCPNYTEVTLGTDLNWISRRLWILNKMPSILSIHCAITWFHSFGNWISFPPNAQCVCCSMLLGGCCHMLHCLCPSGLWVVRTSKTNNTFCVCLKNEAGSLNPFCQSQKTS